MFIATDPDADRVGVAVKHGGGYVILTGNEMGLCLLSYLLEERSARGTLPARPVVVKTIVTTNLAEKIAAKYGAETRNVLTGFKYIGDQMNRLAADGRIDDFIMGYEESCGYLVGDHARDKDAVVACMVLAECADSLKARGMTLVDKLNAIYDEFGRYSHRTISKEFAGASGSARMKELLDAFRAADVKEVGGKKVLEKIGAKGAVGRTGHVRRKPAGALSGRRGHYFKGHCGPDCAQGSFSLLFWLCPKGVWRDGAFVPAGRRDACERVSGTVRRTGL